MIEPVDVGETLLFILVQFANRASTNCIHLRAQYLAVVLIDDGRLREESLLGGDGLVDETEGGGLQLV